MNNPHFYETRLQWKADRIGMLGSPDLETKFEVATPPEFPKGISGIWSPEHLLVAAVESCVMTTFLSIADNSKLEFVSYESTARGKLVQENGKYFISEIVVSPRVVISDSKDLDRAKRIIEKAEQHCLISNSVKSKITLVPEFEIQD